MPGYFSTALSAPLVWELNQPLPIFHPVVANKSMRRLASAYLYADAILIATVPNTTQAGSGNVTWLGVS